MGMLVQLSSTAAQNHNKQKACEFWCKVTPRVFSHELLSHCTGARLYPDKTCSNKAVLTGEESSNEGRQADFNFFNLLFF